MTFEWIPGTELDQSALDRMKQYFPKPEQPPYEAWFMGKVDYHEYIVKLPPHEIDTSSIKYYLKDSITGLRSFSKAEDPVKR